KRFAAFGLGESRLQLRPPLQDELCGRPAGLDLGELADKRKPRLIDITDHLLSLRLEPQSALTLPLRRYSVIADGLAHGVFSSVGGIRKARAPLRAMAAASASTSRARMRAPSRRIHP